MYNSQIVSMSNQTNPKMFSLFETYKQTWQYVYPNRDISEFNEKEIPLPAFGTHFAAWQHFNGNKKQSKFDPNDKDSPEYKAFICSEIAWKRDVSEFRQKYPQEFDDALKKMVPIDTYQRIIQNTNEF